MKGLSQGEVAHILGVTAGAVCHWECGRVFPSAKRLKVIADTLGVKMEELIDERKGVT